MDRVKKEVITNKWLGYHEQCNAKKVFDKEKKDKKAQLKEIHNRF